MKPRWAYIWEYTDLESGERRRTYVAVTPAEFDSLTGQFLDESDARPIEETKVDRNVVRLSAPPARRVPQMPKFDAPNDLELRALWRKHRDQEIRRLILEIVTLRKSLLDILERWESINRETTDRGDLGGPFGHWRKLYFAVRDHLRRAGLM
ncbi:hypothetical protein FEP39_03903 [Burkholderia multivorans]|uniref:hypothetical protein n=1 Tax=Burkholderia multivorans TaxID=87883 RepID=UPI0021C1B16E|nr:hypothetical protein [Burkholderia multivorans]MDR9053017.1 hypothetical protein [Burkholderia multivorans]MDR9058678.1 hypothetical protein [Burkholderia multivorans]MDR9063105.1 hypothetical protein [Burkholderia multivorans]MDR9070672.1 hypothetical protein [Burkholderia multivorans]MDR9076951.1 hypothetical protein [Burkholderia multivorans]